MFFNRKKSYVESGFLNGMIDRHSHILPGVDDGIKTMEDSLAVLDYYESLGIREVWLTPHVMEDIPNTTEKLEDRFGELKLQYSGNIKLHLAAEYMIDSLFVERLEKQDLLTYGEDGKSLLVETSYIHSPIGFKMILEDIKKAGLQPVLAHPERYKYMSETDYIDLHNQGIRFQMNITSLSGAYGESARKRAIFLLEEEFYSYLGTDVHSLESITRAFEGKTLKKSMMELVKGVAN